MSVPDRDFLKKTSADVPHEILETVGNLNALLFGNTQAFKVFVSHKIDGVGVAHAYLQDHFIIINVRNFFQRYRPYFEIRNLIFIEFILAHELSHYLYEYYVRYIGSGLSPNGQESMLCMQGKVEAAANSNNRVEIIEIERLVGSAHAEIDAFATTILMKHLGYSKNQLASFRLFIDFLNVPDQFDLSTDISELSNADIDFWLSSFIRKYSYLKFVGP